VYRGQFAASRQRRHGRDADDVAATRFIVFAQNHDQVGNRARGERSAGLMSPAGLRIAAALVCLAPFLPMLFEGEEWAASTPFLYFTDHIDAELGRAVTEGRRREFAAFGWEPEDVPDPQAERTWDASRLRWDELGEASHAELVAWYRDLLRLRRDEPQLSDGGTDMEVTFDEGDRWLVMRRGPIVVALHANDRAAAVPVPPGATSLMAFPHHNVATGDGHVSFDGEGVAVLRV
jgi:maltooligosyltrehalose trehalohydrolase